MFLHLVPINLGSSATRLPALSSDWLQDDLHVIQIAEGGYSFVFLVEEVLAGVPLEGAEYALKRVSCRLLLGKLLCLRACHVNA